MGSDGTIASTYDYAPFGGVTTNGTAEQPFQWSSEFYDAELGMVYYNFRFYNPLDGRWIARDLIGERGGPNPYQYIDNEVTTEWDGLGLQGFGGPGCHFNSPTCGNLGSNREQVNQALVISSAAYGAVLSLRVIIEGAFVVTKKLAKKLTKRNNKPKPKKNNKTPKGCKPCIPPAGSLRHEIALPATRVHGAHKCDQIGHVKVWKMNQAPPPACKCFWNGPLTLENTQTPPKGSSPDGSPPPNPARGGGPED